MYHPCHHQNRSHRYFPGGGIISGGATSRNVRAETNSGYYFVDDRRRKIKGRVGQMGYDATIVMDKDRLIRNCVLLLSANGVLLSNVVVRPLPFSSLIF